MWDSSDNRGLKDSDWHAVPGSGVGSVVSYT